MNRLRVIVCIENTNRYKNFLEILSEKYLEAIIVNDINAVEKSIPKDNRLPVLFFVENTLLRGMNDVKYQLLYDNNYTIIVLFEEYIESFKRERYIYDLLECKSRYVIDNFLIRLGEDINSKIQLSELKNEARSFYDVGKQLSAEKNIKKLLEIIIDASMEMTNSEAATIYIIVDGESNDWTVYEKNSEDKKMRFVISRNKSMKLNLESTNFPILKDSISGYTIITGEPLRIDDAYDIPPDAEYKFSSRFDKTTGYKTQSMLTVPMKDSQNRVLGVIQLINKKTSEKIIPFNAKDEMIIYSFAGHAAVAVENNLLYKKTENLLQQYKMTVYEEIEKRKAADEEINKLLCAIEQIPISAIITDANGYIQYVNPKFTEITGYSYKEIINKNINILNAGDNTIKFYCEFWQAIQSGKEWHGEFYNRRKNGEFYWEATYVSSIRNENNRIKYFVMAKEDITEKKLINMKLENKNIELQKTINMLHEVQAQLIQKEKMAGIGQLAAGVAHEINNPLGFIMSNYHTLKKYINRFIELLQLYKEYSEANVVSQEEKNEKIKNIRTFEETNDIDFVLEDICDLNNDTDDGLKRIRDIVTALKAFSQIDRLEDMGEYDLNQGIKTTLVIAGNEIKYIASIEKNLEVIPSITAMGGELNQVILNILLNAAYSIKAKVNNAEGVIRIRTYQEDHNVCCSIEDNGIGIKEDILNRIFEPFFTTKPVGEGTGLGLSISYDIIVKKHNGELLVKSTPGIGTIFTIKLPIKQGIENI